MVNVKAFKYSDNTHPILHSFIENDTFYEPSASKLCLKEYKKLKRCEFCRSGFVKMSQELTLKMLFELEDHLKHRGKELSWLENREYRHVDKATLYQRFQVCEDCFKLYTVSQELKTIELSIANGLGIFNEKESRHNNNLSISNLMHLEQFRIIVIFDSIKEHTISFSSMAYVKYSFLGQNSKFHLQAQLGYAQALRHVKIYYCFAKSHKEFEFFLEKHGQITTELYDHNRLIGKTNIPLLDFRSPNVITKTYYQPLSIDTSIYLEAYTGVARDGTQKVNHITFKEHCGVYVCKHHHTSCHPLPSE